MAEIRLAHQSPCSFYQLKAHLVTSDWLHLIGHTAQHCGLNETRLVVSLRLNGTWRWGAQPPRRLAPPWPPLWSGPLAWGAEAGASIDRPLSLVCPSNQSIQHSGGLIQVLRWDQRLPVLLLRDGKHWHADVIPLTRKLPPLSSLATLYLALVGGRRARTGLWRGARGVRTTGGLCWVCCPRKQAEARAGEARAPQVAGGVETPLPLGSLRQRVGGIADGWVGDGAVICLGLQVNVREDLPAVAASAANS